MSWEQFKQNVQRKLCDASKVPSIEYVAEVYATEYDLCIKRGGTLVDRIPIATGNKEAMRQRFLQALKAGLTSKEPYDLTGAMGEGVKEYWRGAKLLTPNPPLITAEQVATGAVANIIANSNTVTDAGQWVNTNQTTANQPNQNNTTQTTTTTTIPPKSGNVKTKILIVGDSISTNVFGTWSNKFKTIQKNADVEILAIGGKQLTLWMKPELEKKLTTTKYDKVYIYGGVNDAFSSKKAETIITSLQSMVDSVITNGGRAYVIKGYDAETDMDIKNMPLTKYIKDKSEYIPLLDEYKKYQIGIDGIKNATIIPKISVGILRDGFHPSAKQATTLYEHILKF